MELDEESKRLRAEFRCYNDCTVNPTLSVGSVGDSLPDDGRPIYEVECDVSAHTTSSLIATVPPGFLLTLEKIGKILAHYCVVGRPLTEGEVRKVCGE